MPVSAPVRSVCAILLLAFVPLATNAAPPPDVLVGTSRANDQDLPRHAVPGTGLVGDLDPATLRAGKLAMRLPDGTPLVVTRQRINQRNSGQSWTGKVDGAEGSLVSFADVGGVVTGFVQLGASLYESRPSKNGRQLLYRVDTKNLPGEPDTMPKLAAATTSSSTSTTSAGTTTLATAAAPIVQDLLVVYSTATQTRYGDAQIQSMITSAVAAANQAYANSGINLTLNLVKMAPVAYVETGDMTTALYALQNPSDGIIDSVHTLRDQVGADVVSMIDEDPNYCGIGFVMPSNATSSASSAFNVVLSDCLSNQTLAHEIGHNQGSQHNIESVGSSSPPLYPYGYGYRLCNSSVAFGDIMAYSCGGPRISSFSSPTVYYQGYPTGVDGSADNARSINGTAATIAAYRSPPGVITPPAAPSGLAANAASSSRIDVTWVDNSTNETGFDVYRSLDGVNFAVTASVGQGVTTFADNSVAASTRYYYEVRAVNSAGASAFSNIANAVTSAPPPPPPSAPTSLSFSLSSATGPVVLTWTDASTNETGFDIQRETYSSRKGTWSATIIASTGANITTYTDVATAGTYRYSVRAKNSGGTSAWFGPTAQVTVAATTTSNARKK